MLYMYTYLPYVSLCVRGERGERDVTPQKNYRLSQNQEEVFGVRLHNMYVFIHVNTMVKRTTYSTTYTVCKRETDFSRNTIFP